MKSKLQNQNLKLEIDFEVRSQSDAIQKQQQFLSSEDIQKMFEAQSRLEEFIEEIGELREHAIRTDVIEHCQRTKLNFHEYISSQSVQRMVKNRIEKMIKNKRIKKNWSQEDIKILTWVVSKYADLKGFSNIEKDLDIGDWKVIATLIPGVEAENCMFKWLSLKKNNLTQHGWGQRQSQLLEKVVRKYGEKDWNLVSQKLYFANLSPHKIYRCAKQCRQHWNCYLNPNLKKGPWTKQEDLHLLHIIKKNKCQKRWAEMVNEFKGRTENALKNRYTLIMEKQIKLHPKTQKLTQLEIIEEFLEKSYVQQFVQQTQKNQKTLEEGMKTRRRQSHKNPNSGSQTKNLKEEENSDLNEGQRAMKEAIKGFEQQKTKLEFVSSAELPTLDNISIVTLTADELKDLAEKIMSQKSDYVPCTYDNNMLKRISRM